MSNASAARGIPDETSIAHLERRKGASHVIAITSGAILAISLIFGVVLQLLGYQNAAVGTCLALTIFGFLSLIISEKIASETAEDIKSLKEPDPVP